MENWRDELPDDLKVNPTLAKYETPADAFNALVELNSRLGRSVVIPNDDSDPEEMKGYYEKLQRTSNGKLVMHPDAAEGDHAKEFWNMLGRPDEVKGYETPEGVTMNPDMVESFKTMALEAGLTKQQFQALSKSFDAQSVQQTEANDAARTADQAIIDSRLGLTKDATLKEIGLLAAQHSDPDNPPAWLADPSLLSAGDVFFLTSIMNGFKGKGPQVFNQPTAGTGLTPDEIEDELKKINQKMIDGGMGMDRGEYKRLTNKKVNLMKMRA